MTGLPGWARNGMHPFGAVPDAYADAVPDIDEKEVLRNQAAFLDQQLKAIRERLEKLEKNN